MASNYTEHYGLCQWEAKDQVLREEFNEGYTKIDAALKAQADDLEAEVSARKEGDNAAAAANCLVKLLEETLEVESQKWDIDMSEIDLKKYHKLLIYPRLRSDSIQTANLHINGLTSGYKSSHGDSTHCGDLPIVNEPGWQNFGICEFTVLAEPPKVCVIQEGVISNYQLYAPERRPYACPHLESGVTHLDTLNFWYDFQDYHLLPGSTVQIYGIKF